MYVTSHRCTLIGAGHLGTRLAAGGCNQFAEVFMRVGEEGWLCFQISRREEKEVEKNCWWRHLCGVQRPERYTIVSSPTKIML